jgi:DNA-binding CsgD family transcriptional regulator
MGTGDEPGAFAMKFDAIGAVEACYAGEGDDEAWLSGLLDAVSPLARDSGVQAQVFRGRAFESLSVERRLVRGIPPDVLEKCDRIFQGAPLEFWSPVPPVDYATTRARRVGDEFLRIGHGDAKQTLRRYGMEDHFGIFVADLDGRGAVIAINIPVGAPLLPPRVVHRLRSLAAHLTSGVRLRSALRNAEREAAGVAGAQPEAVLDPAGHALDASGPARDRAARASLGEAVRLMEKARGRLRLADPDEALQLWRGLVDGTWSLVEHHDTDGKRYLLARRNQPGVREPTALTRNERSVLAFAAMGHQNKYIAYLLGLSPSAVTSHLRSAQRKLGLSSRGDLIRTFAPVVLPAPELGSSSSTHDRPHS